MPEPKHRRVSIALSAAGFLLLLLLLSALNAFNLPFLTPHSAGLIYLFTGLSVIVFLLFLVSLVLLSRNILKLYADERSRVLGSRLRTRMLIGALLISFMPALFMFLFSYGLMNRSIDRWFSQPVMQVRTDSTRVALELAHYATSNARAEAESIAMAPAIAGAFDKAGKTPDPSALENELRSHRVTLQGGFVVLYRDGVEIASYQEPPPDQPARIQPWLEDATGGADSADEPGSGKIPRAQTILHTAQRSDEPVLSIDGTEYALAAAAAASGTVVVVALPMPAGLSATVASIRHGADLYWATFRSRNQLRRLWLTVLLLLTALIFFTSSWLALFLSKQVTRPVEALADAMSEIGDGRYKHRITVAATDELGELIRSFNHMAADLEQSRALAETSSRQLSAANTALEERRRELEMILETIPSGVVTLDPQLRVLQANRTFLDLIQPRSQDARSQNSQPHDSQHLTGRTLESILPAEMAADLTRLVRRSQRMGLATSEFEMRGPSGISNLSATLATLELGKNQRGCILVLEDVTDVLRAQKQVAWKEVAQRVAHEIKNPLTPIGLSAERIRRHVDRPLPESPGVIRKCTEVILGSVETLRTLVDQFAALAQFPTAQPRPADLNQIVESALMLFSGRLEGIEITTRLHSGLPPVMADPEALKRALANLIDNAAEAMQGSLLRRLTIETGLNESPHMAEIVVADTGHGLTAEMRERLFLPYFSTKQRGTGLGLAIAAKIVQEHHGAIRAEQNSPAGARFLLELPFAEAPVHGSSHGPGNGAGNGNRNGHGAEAAVPARTEETHS